MTDIAIRRARPFDAGPMVRLMKEIAAQNGAPGRADPLTEAELRTWMKPDSLWHIAERAGNVAGVQWVEPHPGMPPTTCDIATFVGQTAQDIAIGTRLFDATRAAAKAAGFTHIQTRIDGANDGGLIYYQSRGFERLTPREDLASGGAPAGKVVMTYRL